MCKHTYKLLILLSILTAIVVSCLGDGLQIPETLNTVSSAIIYTVGPGMQYSNLNSVASKLQPGDTVQVYYSSTPYSGGVLFTVAGTSTQKIKIIGVPQNGIRPKISGGTNTVEFRASHYIFQGFEITGGSSRCLYHHADDIYIGDTVVHDCPAQGILGAETGAGSLTLDYVEVYRCGSGTTRHPVYMDTDPQMYPGSIFRMQHSYIHAGLGGNNVKSRAERNEIYYNWIEGAQYREIELIGHSYSAHPRQDSDVVGNVFLKKNTYYVARIGGDGDADTLGRYRFENNDFIVNQDGNPVVQVFDRVETLEMHNNIFYKTGGGTVAVYTDTDGTWVDGYAILGGYTNWIPVSSSIPSQWIGTIFGTDPKFYSASTYDFNLSSGSPIDQGTANPASPTGFPFPNPLQVPLFEPPLGKLETIGGGLTRSLINKIDPGPYEFMNGTNTDMSASVPDDMTSINDLAVSPDLSPPLVCKSAQTNVWSYYAVPSASGAFSMDAYVTPSSAQNDVAVALASTATTSWSGLAAIVLFTNNSIQARKGSSYVSTGLTYVSGSTYHVKLVGNVSSHIYSVYIGASGGADKLVETNLAFRTEQANVATIGYWVIASDAGNVTACFPQTVFAP